MSGAKPLLHLHVACTGINFTVLHFSLTGHMTVTSFLHCRDAPLSTHRHTRTWSTLGKKWWIFPCTL